IDMRLKDHIRGVGSIQFYLINKNLHVMIIIQTYNLVMPMATFIKLVHILRETMILLPEWTRFEKKILDETLSRNPRPHDEIEFFRQNQFLLDDSLFQLETTQLVCSTL